MGFLTQQQKDNISAAIKQAEAQTSGELVAVIAHESDDYYYIPLLWAAISALVLPAILMLLPVGSSDYSLYQVLTFIIAALLFRWQPLKMWLIPSYVKQRRAALVAREQFLAQNLHHTEQRNGILLFVSVAERYVEIMADKGINDVVAADTWDKLVQQFVENVKAGEVEQGFITAINTSAGILQQHFPILPKDQNELPNHLIELD